MLQSPDHYAVTGHPIDHSRSPEIHTLFAEQTQQHLTYGKLESPIDGFAKTATKFFDEGGKGLNITLPFKAEAAQFADFVSQRAQLAGAVNTLTWQKDGRILGDNTDGIGLVNDLVHNLGQTIQDKRLLILGAGGAVRGVMAPLLATQPAQITLANRTESKAQNLALHFAHYGNVKAVALDQGHIHAPYDIVINSISSGLQGQMPDLPGQLFSSQAFAYDLIYANTLTPFLSWAQTQGVTHLSDGFGMLVEQAAESFYIWRHVRPDTQTIIHKLRP